jgi:hypothetical protein
MARWLYQVLLEVEVEADNEEEAETKVPYAIQDGDVLSETLELLDVSEDD